MNTSPPSAGTPGFPGGRRALPVEYERFVHGPGVHVPDRIAAFLVKRLKLGQLATQVRGVDVEADAVLLSLVYAGNRYLTAISAPGKATSVVAEHDARSEWLTTEDAAVQLGIGERAVRYAITSGRLPAEKHDDRWHVSRADLEKYQTQRTA